MTQEMKPDSVIAWIHVNTLKYASKRNPFIKGIDKISNFLRIKNESNPQRNPSIFITQFAITFASACRSTWKPLKGRTLGDGDKWWMRTPNNLEKFGQRPSRSQFDP